jgi:YVTN family beta-propeller protein
VINTATGKAIAAIGGLVGPTGIAVSPDSSRVYVADEGDDSVAVIDTATNQMVGAPVRVGSVPVAVAFTPDGARAYVANRADDSLSVIDTGTNQTVDGPIDVGKGPRGVAITDRPP